MFESLDLILEGSIFGKRKKIKISKEQILEYAEEYIEVGVYAKNILLGTSKYISVNKFECIGLALISATDKYLQNLYDAKRTGYHFSIKEIISYMDEDDDATRKAIELIKSLNMKVVESDNGGNYYLIGSDLKFYDWDHESHPQLTSKVRTIHDMVNMYDSLYDRRNNPAYFLVKEGFNKNLSPEEIMEYVKTKVNELK